MVGCVDESLSEIMVVYEFVHLHRTPPNPQCSLHCHCTRYPVAVHMPWCSSHQSWNSVDVGSKCRLACSPCTTCSEFQCQGPALSPMMPPPSHHRETDGLVSAKSHHMSKSHSRFNQEQHLSSSEQQQHFSSSVAFLICSVCDM